MCKSEQGSRRSVEIMTEAGQILGVSQVRLIGEWDLETVHVSVEDDVSWPLTEGKRIGLAGDSDDEILDRASVDERIVTSHNTDFGTVGLPALGTPSSIL